MNVLIVDDEATTVALLRRAIVRECDCRVVEAANGLEALELLQEEPFDLVVTDIRMPVMDGIELLEAVRAFPPLAPLPVVMMSAQRDEGLVRRAIQLGISAYLIKPLDTTKVAHRLKPLLDQTARAARAREAATPSGGPSAGAARGPLDQQSAYLVADGNGDFRHFFKNMFETKVPVLEASTGLQAFEECLRATPGVLFVGEDLGVLSADLLIRKVRSTPSLAQVMIVRVASGRGAQEAKPGEADGVVRKTFVPDTFRAQVERLLGHRDAVTGVLITQPSLRMHMASAAEQVFGMMLGLEVETLFDGMPSLPAGAVAASQFVDWAEGGERLHFTVRCQASYSRKVASAMLAMDEAEVDDSLALDTFGEISNIITGRLIVAFATTNIHVSCTLPEMSRTTATWPEHGVARGLNVRCRSLDSGAECVVSLVAVAAPRPATGGAAFGPALGGPEAAEVSAGDPPAQPAA